MEFLVVKVWLHLSKAQQRDRLRELESDARTAWRVSPEDWRSHREYDRISRLQERMRKATHKPKSPWTVIDGSDPRSRNLAVAELLLSRFKAHWKLHSKVVPNAKPRKTTSLRAAGLKKLLALPLNQKLSQANYEEKRDKWMGRLNRAVRDAARERRSIVWVFEGWDAAGKGGAIRRLTDAIDARDYRRHPDRKADGW